jgi:hypothetical protein
MKAIGKYLADVVKRNPKDFRMFSPDELASNKLDDVLSVTDRNFQWDPETAHKGGRVTEILSEHTLQGWLQGYTMTGRHGVFPSYEAFLGIVASEFSPAFPRCGLRRLPLTHRSSPSSSYGRPVYQVPQDGSREQVARTGRRPDLHRDFDLDSPG